MVVFENGRPKSSDYRRFRIKTVSGADDYAMMQEVLRRRFKHRSPKGNGDGKGRDAWAIIPDLVLIDGGKGQLNVVLEVMRELEVEFVPVAALAKENEEVFVPSIAESILLPRSSQALYLLQRVRDEAHRFALSYHVRLRRKRGMTSALDAVPGVGPKRKRALLRKFGSVKAIREATLEELASAPGMTMALAESVKDHL
jgi:excinuclease ABC subunit C